MRTPFVTLSVMGLLAIGLAAGSEDTPSTDIGWKIRREAVERSQILPTLHVLTDVYGPRLTGSPNLKQAAEWAVQQMTSWGLSNAKLEAWEFGHPGWLNERFTAHLVSPVKDALVGEVLAWTPSTTRRRARRRVSADAARASLGRGAYDVSRWRRRQGQRARGAHRHASEGRRHLQPGGQTIGRRRGARPVRRGRTRRRRRSPTSGHRRLHRAA